MKYVLTIAGSDSGGGAGIQADIKTITSLGCHPMSAITALTAQNSIAVEAVHEVPAEFISRQLTAVIEDQVPDAVKIGMLSSGEVIKAVAKTLKDYGLNTIVIDPVLKATSGKDLMEPEAVAMLKERLLPVARIVTPNLAEAGILTGNEVTSLPDMEKAALQLKALGPDVVITGGHLTDQCIDLFFDGNEFKYISDPKINTLNTHGSGCVFSSSLASFLSMGYDTYKAAESAHDFTRKAIEAGYLCGRGDGVVNPGWGMTEDRSIIDNCFK
ncbi:bifunctional hydroxymethylpyrimidine kinase/phosphomethylpyrimidine kinase [Thermodesulfobacteriota bacterium]